MAKKKPFTYDWSTPKTALKSFWYLVWHDESLIGWIANIIFAFIIIKFILFPGLGFIFGTQYPIVAVVSGSMEHDGSFDDWWTSPACDMNEPCTQQQWYESRDIDRQLFQTFPYRNGFNKGDVMILFGIRPEEVELGDVVVYDSLRKYPIIHRVIDIDYNGTYTFQTKGDHNPKMIRDYAVQDSRGNYYGCFIQQGMNILLTDCERSGGMKIPADMPGAVEDLNEYNVGEQKIYGKAVFRIPWVGWVKIWAVNLISWLVNLFI